jgi:hypothetical protein
MVVKSVLLLQSSFLSISQIQLSEFHKTVSLTISNIVQQTLSGAQTDIIVKSVLLDQSSFLSISRIPLSEFDMTVGPPISNIYQQTFSGARTDLVVKSHLVDPVEESILFDRSPPMSHSEALNQSTAVNGFAELEHMDFKHKRRVELCRKDDDSRKPEDPSE